MGTDHFRMAGPCGSLVGSISNCWAIFRIFTTLSCNGTASIRGPYHGSLGYYIGPPPTCHLLRRSGVGGRCVGHSISHHWRWHRRCNSICIIDSPTFAKLDENQDDSRLFELYKGPIRCKRRHPTSVVGSFRKNVSCTWSRGES
jgi:hypothetical protein